MEQQQQMVKPAATALEVSRKRMNTFLTAKVDSLARWVRGGVDPRALVRFALLEWQQNRMLQEATHESMYLALIACAQVGLEPSGTKQEAYIVPFRDWKTKRVIATFMPGWRGLIKLALRSKAVKTVSAHLVYANDVFEPQLGSDQKIVHRPAPFGSDRGELVGTYAVAKLENGEIEAELMNMDDLERIRRSAMKGDKESPAYRDWGDQMYRKAPIRRLCKRLPLGAEYFLAARLDELLEGGDLRTYKDVIDVDGELPEMEPLPTEGESAPALPEGTTTQPPPARGTQGVKEQLRKARKQAETEPLPPAAAPPPAPAAPKPSEVSEIDPVDLEVMRLEDELERIKEHPGDLASVISRVEGLPNGDDKLRLRELCAAARKELGA